MSRFAACLLALLFAACGKGGDSAREAELRQAVGQVRSIITDVGRSPIASLSLQSTLEGGGTIHTYVVAALPEGGPFRNIQLSLDAPKPWSVVIRPGASEREFLVEGYGEKTSQPLVSEKAIITELKRAR